MSSGDPRHQSGAWFASRPDAELQHEIDQGFIGERAHDAAVAELERRRAARERRAEMRWIKLTFWATVILGLGAIAAAVI